MPQVPLAACHPSRHLNPENPPVLPPRPPLAFSMERGAPEYSQSGLPSPHPSVIGDTQSKAEPVDPSAAQYAGQQEARSASYSNSATPTSDYSVYPTTSRSSTFPDMQRSYHPASNPNGASGGMPQTPTSPSMSLQDAHSHHQNPQPEQAKSDSALPIDPSIAGASPTYATHSQYPPYAPPPQDMSQGYQHPGTPGLYTQPRPDWGGYGQQPPGHITPGTHIFHQAPATAAAQGRPHQVGPRVCAPFALDYALISPDMVLTKPSLGLQLRPDSWRPAAQAAQEALRGD